MSIQDDIEVLETREYDHNGEINAFLEDLNQ
jgi:hypothetical protein